MVYRVDETGVLATASWGDLIAIFTLEHDIGSAPLRQPCGLSKIRLSQQIHHSLHIYFGDTLWALAAFLGIGLILTRQSTRTVAFLAMAFSIAIELSQLYHAPWIDSIRQTTLGGLILGFGFLWSDLACYAAGVGLGVTSRCGSQVDPATTR